MLFLFYEFFNLFLDPLFNGAVSHAQTGQYLIYLPHIGLVYLVASIILLLILILVIASLELFPHLLYPHLLF